MNVILVIMLVKAVVSLLCIRLVFRLHHDRHYMKSHGNGPAG
ncbi:hypothetical protein SXCC_02603 [Gluconacetobacter sp. SXCC-1]|nr:hypothetical protein SXCC_02603 [Gluconacetobacter sp. SXCC-1]